MTTTLLRAVNTLQLSSSCFEFLPRGTFGKYSDLESVVENKILALISDKDRNNILNQKSAFLETKMRQI